MLLTARKTRTLSTFNISISSTSPNRRTAAIRHETPNDRFYSNLNVTGFNMLFSGIVRNQWERSCRGSANGRPNKRKRIISTANNKQNCNTKTIQLIQNWRTISTNSTVQSLQQCFVCTYRFHFRRKTAGTVTREICFHNSIDISNSTWRNSQSRENSAN